MRAVWLKVYMVLLAAACLVACAPQAPDRITADGYPADFSLTLLVDDADGRRLFLVEPDRTLRAATGGGVHAGLYPPRTAKLTRGQMRALYELTGKPGAGHHEVVVRQPNEAERALVEVLDRWAGLG
jgi:hypothetical protein